MEKSGTETLRSDLILETEPRPEDIRFLEERLYDFNTEATGITDGELFGFFIRAANGSPVSFCAGGDAPTGSGYAVDVRRRSRGEGTELSADHARNLRLPSAGFLPKTRL